MTEISKKPIVQLMPYDNLQIWLTEQAYHKADIRYFKGEKLWRVSLKSQRISAIGESDISLDTAITDALISYDAAEKKYAERLNKSIGK